MRRRQQKIFDVVWGFLCVCYLPARDWLVTAAFYHSDVDPTVRSRLFPTVPSSVN